VVTHDARIPQQFVETYSKRYTETRAATAPREHLVTGPLTRKVALVTGAGQGAGQGVAEALAEDGATVAVVGRTLSKLETVVGGIESFGGHAVAIRCDVGSSDEIDATVDGVVTQFGTVDVLVNAAHHNTRGGALLDVDDEDVDLLWRTGPLATLRFMRACHPHLAGGGNIVNFGSGAQFAPEGYGVYAGTKDAIQAITRAAAVEWGRDGIRANLIVPHVTSPSMEAALADPARRARSLASIPIGRFGQPADIGRVAAFLAGPDAAFVTGQTILVDGGMKYHR
jgi:NAD(P)-dependent dehydrogenase (short-subunit alcohol dehydrogenase family)